MQVSDVQLMARLSITRGRGRLRTSVWTVGVVLSVVVALVLGAPTGGSADGGDDDSPCKGLHGVCLGLCTAADALGCQDNEPDRPLIRLVCRNLEKKLEKFDCEIPPPVTCPCEGLENPPAVWGDAFPTGECNLVNDGTLFVLTNRVSNTDGTLNVFSTGECILFRGPANPQVSRDGLTDLEVAACEASLRQIALNDGVTCPEEGL
jgi:hypothetical protein